MTGLSQWLFLSRYDFDPSSICCHTYQWLTHPCRDRKITVMLPTNRDHPHVNPDSGEKRKAHVSFQSNVKKNRITTVILFQLRIPAENNLKEFTKDLPIHSYLFDHLVACSIPGKCPSVSDPSSC